MNHAVDPTLLARSPVRPNATSKEPRLGPPLGAIASHATPYPYRWPKVDRRSVAMLRDGSQLLAGFDPARIPPIVQRLVGVPLSLRTSQTPQLAVDALAALPNEQAGALFATAEGKRFAFAVDGGFASWLVERLLGGEPTLGAPTPIGDLERGILAFLAASLCSASPWRLVTVVTSKDTLAGAFSRDAVVLGTEVLGLGASLQAQGWFWFEAHSLPEPARTLPSVEGLPLLLQLQAGQLRLTGDELASLRSGDTVLLEGPSPWELLCGDHKTEVQRVPEGLEILLPWKPRGGQRTMTEPTDTDALSDPAQAPVELRLELARFALPLETVQRLHPGQVVSTRIGIGGQVRLVAGDQLLGTGELVDVDGDVGVRILRIAQT